MYPVNHQTLKIEQAERHREAAQLRLAASAGGTRRWWSLASWLRSATPAAPAPAPARSVHGLEPEAAPATPEPAMAGTADDDRVLVGR